MLSNSSVKLSFEQTVESLILGIAYVLGQTFNRNPSSVIISDLEILVLLSHVSGAVGVSGGNQIANSLVINFAVTDSDCNSLIKPCLSEGKNLADSSGDYSTVLVLGSGSGHGVGFTSSSLTVTHDGSVEALDN
jgi:hypothetical protein